MNISGLIKNFLGDSQPSEPKTLELKSGEVVKGMVMQVLSEQDAILNIGGVQVRAKLETPLKQGEVTMLQVQPESASGQIVLKPLDASVVQIADGSLAEILKNVGLSDTAGNRQLLQALHQAGISLNKETVQAFAQLQSQLPATMSLEDWLPSAIIAQQKGIPLTPESVNAIRAAVAGPAFHETLQQLESQMTKLMSDNPALSASTKAAIDTLKQVMASVKEMSAQLLPESVATDEPGMNGPKGQAPAESRQAALPSTQSGSNQPATLTTAPAAGQQASAMDNESIQMQSAGMLKHTAQQAETAPRAGSPIPPVNTGLTGLVTDAQEQPITESKAATGSAVPSNNVENAQKIAGGGTSVIPSSSQSSAIQSEREQTFSIANNTKRTDAMPHEPSKNNPLSSDNTTQEPAAGKMVSPSADSKDQSSRTGFNVPATADDGALAANKGAQPSEHWIPKLMKALGVDHENQVFKMPDGKVNDPMPRIEGPALQVQAGLPSAAFAQEQAKMADSLKSVLMQLSQSQDIPPSMKDTVQQAIQQITGQQLMLNSDRSSMFTHITMFVPLLNANGEQTAAIHIQSRKGKKGELDAQNCRLVFDLRMKALGDTMVDVKVVDRIVSLQVMNDQPFLHDLLDSYRDEISSSLAGVGYQFISLKCSPYPEKGLGSDDSTAPSKLSETALPTRLLNLYGNKQYKGMDVRV